MLGIAHSILPLKLVESYSAGLPKEKISHSTRSQFPTTPTERYSSVIWSYEHKKHKTTSKHKLSHTLIKVVATECIINQSTILSLARPCMALVLMALPEPVDVMVIPYALLA